jgi:hypothetical protein
MGIRNVALAAALGAALVAGAPTAAGAQPAQAENAGSGDVALLRSGLAKYGVPASAQERLIRDFVTGARVWDSQSGAAPVSVATTRSGDLVTTVARYRDGSVTATSVEQPVSGRSRA